MDTRHPDDLFSAPTEEIETQETFSLSESMEFIQEGEVFSLLAAETLKRQADQRDLSERPSKRAKLENTQPQMPHVEVDTLTIHDLPFSEEDYMRLEAETDYQNHQSSLANTQDWQQQARFPQIIPTLSAFQTIPTFPTFTRMPPQPAPRFPLAYSPGAVDANFIFKPLDSNVLSKITHFSVKMTQHVAKEVEGNKFTINKIRQIAGIPTEFKELGYVVKHGQYNYLNLPKAHFLDIKNNPDLYPNETPYIQNNAHRIEREMKKGIFTERIIREKYVRQLYKVKQVGKSYAYTTLQPQGLSFFNATKDNHNSSDKKSEHQQRPKKS